MNAGTRYHLALTWDGTTKRLWLDGQKIASKPTDIAFDAQGIAFGQDLDNGSPSATFTGMVDDVWIFGRALGGGELVALSVMQ